VPGICALRVIGYHAYTKDTVISFVFRICNILTFHERSSTILVPVLVSELDPSESQQGLEVLLGWNVL